MVKLEDVIRQAVLLKEDKAAQEPVVKHQVHDEMLLVKREADLAAHERKAGAEFQKELLKMVDDAAFQLTLRVFRELPYCRFNWLRLQSFLTASIS